jgi:hypothetical protein
VPLNLNYNNKKTIVKIEKYFSIPGLIFYVFKGTYVVLLCKMKKYLFISALFENDKTM